MKKKAFMIASLATGILAIAATSLVGAKPTSLKGTNAGSESYGISFDSTNNKFHDHIDDFAYDGDAIAKTDLENNIGFKYCKVIGATTSWHVLGTGGYFCNADPIHGMESIQLTFNSSDVAYSIYYSGDKNFEHSKSFVSETGSTFSFDFDGCKPNYFKLVNTDTNGNLDIASIRISLSCQNNYSTLSISSSDETMGSVSGGGVKKTGSEVTITATPDKGYKFVGWYKGDDFISNDNPYKLMMPSNDYVVTAKFVSELEARHAAFPMFSNDGKTIKYGLYPQTNVDDLSLISILDSLTEKETNGWYLYNDDYYAKVTAKPYNTLITQYFANGTAVKEGKTYWFKCEPIEWGILEDNDGQCFVTSRFLLDRNYYNSSSNRTIDGKTIYPNNYKYSHIREWLNGDFYNSAFSHGNANVLTTTVDNSSSSTGDSSNQNVCGNTNDKVFLLSYKELEDSNYGVSKFVSPTDYALCQGIITSSVTNATYWWLRSPAGLFYTSKAKYVGRYGNVDSDEVARSYYGIRPSMKISLD